MKRTIIAGLATLALIGTGIWWFTRPAPDSNLLTLYGNVDIRQVSLAFEGSDRVIELRVEEGDKVKAGQVLALLDTRTLRLEAAQAEAKIAAQEQILLRLRNGSRPEEIAQARARTAAANADAAIAAQDLQRLQELSRRSDGQAIKRQDLDHAVSNLQVARAQAEDQRKALRLAELGPRAEDIAQAEAELQSTQAELALLQLRLSQAELKAPADAVVRSRLLEPGDMASPQKPVFALALIEPKWVRVYVTEPQLGQVRPGMRAQVSTDSHPAQSIEGSVGYISSVAEFTPKAVQTEELRTSLVYEIRVRVRDPEDRLRLGMPATVRLALNSMNGNQGATP
ncbi:HlyD family efflux transporter periplasmic adaptor subunit [Azomonas macrocytogenes]|uniref:HlyD family secretion protein n=1 Tax=Azomonas macrocytogenes TaxID=69962 RepID=A0A839TAZ6_AZOMA|nr:HlyD family efflux transporter periplasmic adaptor subunit [Azomonas macrocytogenes]MBB3105225.1 HlyD family secretion protein [Azomonas macrocytogenes]